MTVNTFETALYVHLDVPKRKTNQRNVLEKSSKIVQAFGIAALKCKQAGADGVEIHAAHGYLISQFLSPY